MRYSLLNFLQCPHSATELVCLTLKEIDDPLPHVRQLSEARRINKPGALVGPVPNFTQKTDLTEKLRAVAWTGADPARNYQVRVEEGLLVSAETGRWYPIRNFIPEILPDHLRNFDRDFEFLQSQRKMIPGHIFDALNRLETFTERTRTDQGIGHKTSEMTITDKIDDPGFFGPGQIAPFNPGATEHSVYLIKAFASCLSMLLAGGKKNVVLDAGCGYSWTTNWLMMLGFEPIGIDISRVYLDIAVKRLGPYLPYVMVADTENLPIRDGVLDAVLGYDAFHHIPDRNRAMQGFYRTLRPGGEVILSEPGAEHEHAPGVQEVMDRFGTLERGMSLENVISYVAGTGFQTPKQHIIVKFEQDVNRYVHDGSGYSPANLYSITKPAQQSGGPGGLISSLRIDAASAWRRLAGRRRSLPPGRPVQS